MVQRMFIGIDVSKARLDVAFRPGGETFNVNNDTRGIARLIKIVKSAERSVWCSRPPAASS